jgi:hypothetical protein
LNSKKARTGSMADQFEAFSGVVTPELLARVSHCWRTGLARPDAIKAIDAWEKPALPCSALKSGY